MKHFIECSFVGYISIKLPQSLNKALGVLMANRKGGLEQRKKMQEEFCRSSSISKGKGIAKISCQTLASELSMWKMASIKRGGVRQRQVSDGWNQIGGGGGGG